MKIFAAAAVAILLTSGMAYTHTMTGAISSQNSGGSSNYTNPNYLTGRKTQTLFIDDTRNTVRPPSEFKAAWEKLNEADRADIKRACTANRDVSYNPLCTNAKNM